MPTEPQPAPSLLALDPDGSARQEAYSAIDELIRNALAYHTPERFVELMKFTRRLPKYSPFNCMLLHIQNPNLKYVARPQQWADMGRKVKPGARPLVILAPMHPVMFVFDVSDTEGSPLPPDIEREIEDPFAVEGSMSSSTWNKMESACKKMNIELQDVPLEASLAGDVRRVRELEAEAVAYLVTSRIGLYTASKKYLSIYLQPGVTLPPYSMETILTAAGAVELMAKGKLPGKERARRKRAGESKPKQKLRVPLAK
jgi:hypothetical protein